MSEQSVRSIALMQLFRSFGILSVGRRKDDLFQQTLHAPLQVVSELNRQVIEQLGMRRWLARTAEVFERLHDADAKQLGPQSIDHYPGG